MKIKFMVMEKMMLDNQELEIDLKEKNLKNYSFFKKTKKLLRKSVADSNMCW